jgi:hypothetical protein
MVSAAGVLAISGVFAACAVSIVTLAYVSTNRGELLFDAVRESGGDCLNCKPVSDMRIADRIPGVEIFVGSEEATEGVEEELAEERTGEEIGAEGTEGETLP